MYVRLCSSDEIPDNTSKAFEVEDCSILLCRTGGKVYAIENRCTHQETPLENGRIRRGFICCPLHGVMFDLATGEPKGQLTRIPVRTFVVQEENGELSVAYP